jgi:hypothetical protein
MPIAIAGTTGRIGRIGSDGPEGNDHQVVGRSRSRGIDLTTGADLEQSLQKARAAAVANMSEETVS